MRFNLDENFTTALLGCPVKPPLNWWVGMRGRRRVPGRIAGINLEDDCRRHFLFEADEEPGVFYPMRYDAVRAYANREHEDCSSYWLPKRPPRAEKMKASRELDPPAEIVPEDVPRAEPPFKSSPKAVTEVKSQVKPLRRPAEDGASQLKSGKRFDVGATLEAMKLAASLPSSLPTPIVVPRSARMTASGDFMLHYQE